MRRRHAFTLLEAVLAMAILAGAVMATLGIRARSMVAAEQMESVQRDERDAQAVFDLLVAGMLGSPQRVDAEGVLVEWVGSLSGSNERGYEVVRKPVSVANPLRAESDGQPTQVGVWRYTVQVGGAEVVFLWHR